MPDGTDRAEHLIGRLSDNITHISGRLSEADQLRGALSLATVRTYSGPYQVTPTQEQQVLSISGRQATEDIIIDPIPSNYGLITWNGSVLTVS